MDKNKHLPLICYFFLASFLPISLAQTNNCDHPDYEAIVAIYNSIIGLNWDIDNCDICSFTDNISCDENGRVSSLSIGGESFSGTIPEQIGDLIELRSLNITLTNIKGNIPNSIGRLTKLSELNLFDNQLTGSIPSGVGNLTSLRILFLGRNQLTGTIPPEFGKLFRMMSLDLKENQFTGSIPPELGKLSNLITLSLENNQLIGSIPAELAMIGSDVIVLQNKFFIKLNDNNLDGCYPNELSLWCNSFYDINLSNNPNLPNNGDFTQFCSTQSGLCEDINTANCEGLQFTSENGQITVKGLTPQSRIEIIGRNTDWEIVPICDNDCSESQTISDLKAGEYAVKVNLLGNDGSYCYREEEVNVSSSGNNTGGKAGCDNLMFTGENEQITIKGLTATYNKVEIIGRNTDWKIVTICDGNCSDTQIIPDLQAGEYAVKINQAGADGSYCYREEKVNVSSGGGSNTGGSANCDDLAFTTENGQITVNGLTATYKKIELIGRNTDWQVVTICDGNCSDTQIIPDLQAGEYAVKINQGGNDGSYCYREEKVNLLSNNLSNSSRTNNKIQLATYQKAQQIQLQWFVNSIEQTNYFLLERSVDGKSFEPIQLISNFDDNQLNWLDEQPQKGENHYRVRQVFSDKSTIYSSIQTQKIFLADNEITLFPNPAKETINLHLKALQGKNAHIQIHNAFGQLVQHIPTQSYESPYYAMDLNNFDNGIYLLSIKVGYSPIFTKRFVVENLK